MNENNNKNNETICELGLKIVDLVESYIGKLPPYEVGHQLIMNGVSMLLATAPNEYIGLKTALACVETGIAFYEEAHQSERKKK